VEILRMFVFNPTLDDLAELEPTGNKMDVTLGWGSHLSFADVFSVFKRWRQLRRLMLDNRSGSDDSKLPAFNELGDFIMAMKHLSHLHIPSFARHMDDPSYSDNLETLRVQFNEFISLWRPNFKFDISFRLCEVVKILFCE
jgi:hypothetical protein